jgi:gluconolactonase
VVRTPAANPIPGDPTFRTLAPLAHCEGVATGPDGMLWAGDEQGTLYRIDPSDGSHRAVAEGIGWGLGLCLDAASRVYVCSYDRGAVVRVDPGSGAVEVYCDRILGGKPLRAPNWPVFAPDGTLFVSDSGTEDLDERDGSVVAVPPGGGDARVLPTPPLAFANGMALAPDSTLYVLESFEPRVRAIRDSEVAVYADLPGTVPDGLALDEEGGLLVAIFQPNRVLRIPPGGGEPQVLLDDWTGQRLLTPTNITFFGPELKSLAIASLCGWRLSAVDTPWRGQALFYPSLS